MGCRITQRKHGIKLFQIFFCLLSFHRLGFVNNQNRIGFCQNINGTPGTKLIQLHVNTPGIFALCIKRLGVNDHHINGIIRSKPVNLCQLGRIINKIPDLFTVLFCKMIFRSLERFVHTFTDGNAGHHDNELTPAILLVQFIHCFDVCICFPDTGFHLNGQVITVAASFQLFRRFQLVCLLNLPYMFQNNFIFQLRHNLLIAPTGKINILCQALLICAGSPIHHI